MVHDEAATQRMRAALAALGLVLDERRMMGGVCFMLHGNMLSGAHRERSGDRLFMFRVGPWEHEWAMRQPHARPVQMGDRMPMQGFAFVEVDACKDARLQIWLKKALAFVGPLPAR